MNSLIKSRNNRKFNSGQVVRDYIKVDKIDEAWNPDLMSYEAGGSLNVNLHRRVSGREKLGVLG